MHTHINIHRYTAVHCYQFWLLHYYRQHINIVVSKSLVVFCISACNSASFNMREWCFFFCFKTFWRSVPCLENPKKYRSEKTISNVLVWGWSIGSVAIFKRISCACRLNVDNTYDVQWQSHALACTWNFRSILIGSCFMISKHFMHRNKLGDVIDWWKTNRTHLHASTLISLK